MTVFSSHLAQTPVRQWLDFDYRNPFGSLPRTNWLSSQGRTWTYTVYGSPSWPN